MASKQQLRLANVMDTWRNRLMLCFILQPTITCCLTRHCRQIPTCMGVKHTKNTTRFMMITRKEPPSSTSSLAWVLRFTRIQMVWAEQKTITASGIRNPIISTETMKGTLHVWSDMLWKHWTHSSLWNTNTGMLQSQAPAQMKQQTKTAHLGDWLARPSKGCLMQMYLSTVMQTMMKMLV